ncbi:MAG: hypothetical protein ACI87E_003208, partial [Mariniblastus sp.]
MGIVDWRWSLISFYRLGDNKTTSISPSNACPCFVGSEHLTCSKLILLSINTRLWYPNSQVWQFNAAALTKELFHADDPNDSKQTISNERAIHPFLTCTCVYSDL